MKWSLFIGRFQPLHDGHIKLIRRVLDDEGKPVLIALRDTPINESNPFTLDERRQMFQKEFGDRVKVIAIPNISAVCYGRKVGYDVRRIRLNSQTEEISGTKTRDSQKGVVWLTGNMGAGKTSLAYLLKERLDGVVLDGDEMRQSISTDAGFSKQDRHSHNLRVARLAKTLNAQGQNVIVSVIAPFRATRKEIEGICNPYWIYITGGAVGKDKPYQKPLNPDVTIRPSRESLLRSMDKIIKEIGKVNKIK